MQIQFKKTIINSQLNSKRQKGAPLSAPNSAYTKVDTFLLHKLVQRITPVHSCPFILGRCGASLGDAERRMPPRVTTTWKRTKRGGRSGQEVKSGERERKSKRQPFKKYRERWQHRKSREEHLLLGGLIWYPKR